MADWNALIPDAPFDWALIPLDGCKRPIDPETGEILNDWQLQDGYDVAGISALNGKVDAVGLMLGEKSGGVLQVDFDGPASLSKFQEVFGRKPKELPSTIGVKSGKPKRGSRFFLVDSDWWDSLRGRKVWKDADGDICLELRWAGHQAVIAGKHPETNGYSWMPNSSPADLEMAMAPDWLLEPLIRTEATYEPVQVSAEDAQRAIAMLQCIDPNSRRDYDGWLEIGMALHHTDPGLLSNWIEWSQQMANFDEAECLQKWQGFSDYKGQSLTIGTLHHYAKEGGYKEPKRQPVAQSVDGVEGDDEDLALDELITEKVGELLDLRLTTTDTWAKEMALIAELGWRGVKRPDVEGRMYAALADRWHLAISQSHTKKRRGRAPNQTRDGEQQQMLVHGFLPWKRDAVLFGPGGVGKTTAAVRIAWSAITCEPFLDHEIPSEIKGRVLFIGSDGGTGAYDMFQNTAEDLGIAKDSRWQAGIEHWGADEHEGVGAWSVTPAGLQELKTELEEGDYALVIIDSWKAVLELAGVDFGIGPVGTIVRLIQALIGQHCSALYLHHPSGNTKGKGIGGAGGNQNINQIPYAVHELRVEPVSDDRPKCVRWIAHKLRGYTSREFLYRLMPDGLQVIEGEVVRNCRDDVLITISDFEQMGTATTSHAIQNLLSNRNEATIRNNLTKLRQDKFLEKSGANWHLTTKGKHLVAKLTRGE